MGRFGYTTIQEWMYGLDLSLSATVCLAVIFGFSQDGESTFKGSRKYLARRMCVKDRKTVDAALSKLCELNLIAKLPVNLNGVNSPEYKVTPHCFELAISLGYGNMPQGVEISDNGEEKTDSHSMEKTDRRINSNRTNGIQQRCGSFDLAKALVDNLGVSAQAANDWSEIRRVAGIHETVTGFEAIAKEVRECCTHRGVTADDCVKYAVLRGWKTFEAGYECPGLTMNMSQKRPEILNFRQNE